jgi:predicted nucleic acid-binding protein
VAGLAMLDTMICVWAFKGGAKAGQDDKARQARALISSLDEQGFELGISAITLSELMVALPEEMRLEFSRSVQDALCVYAFDVRASIEAARLFKSRLRARTRGEVEREVVEADCQIAGTALASGACVLYTEDPRLRKLLKPRLATKAMPPIGQQELDL